MTTARVLVVDDEPAVIKFVAANLRARGYDVADASNGLEAVERVKD
jgi:CheY-like chemotaxis protein